VDRPLPWVLRLPPIPGSCHEHPRSHPDRQRGPLPPRTQWPLPDRGLLGTRMTPSGPADLEAVDPEGAPSGIVPCRAAPPQALPWRAAVGPPVWMPFPGSSRGEADPSGEPSPPRSRPDPIPEARGFPPIPPSLDAVRFITWNLRVGAGDLGGFVDSVQREGEPFVLLLQEAVRVGNIIPRIPPRGSRWAGRIADPLPPGRTREDVGQVARTHGLSLLYAPSMRSGGPGDPPEDRGNAILSSLPLEAPRLIELPVERQRRVGVVATVRVQGGGPNPVPLQLVSVHLENRAPWRRFWRIPGAARTAQAQALLQALGTSPDGAGTGDAPGLLPTPLVMGGDLNSWWGQQREGAVRLLRRHLPHPVTLDPVPTHHWELGLDRQSDYLLFRLPDGWTAWTRRLPEELGSDHWPVEGRITASSGSGGSPRRSGDPG